VICKVGNFTKTFSAKKNNHLDYAPALKNFKRDCKLNEKMVLATKRNLLDPSAKKNITRRRHVEDILVIKMVPRHSPDQHSAELQTT